MDESNLYIKMSFLCFISLRFPPVWGRGAGDLMAGTENMKGENPRNHCK